MKSLSSRFLALSAALLASVAIQAQQPAVAPVKPAAHHAAASACTIRPVDYDGWKATEMRNAWVKLVFVPQIGGRLMQVTFNGHDYLFVNDQFKGQNLGRDTVHHRWVNYGGDKIWPMPEGNDDEQHWAGAGGSVLDEDPFKLSIVSRGSTCTVRMTGPTDPQIGQQYIRDVSIGTDSPVIHFHAVMKNTTGYPQDWSEQSVSQYNAASPDNPADFNHKFWGKTPANPASVFPGGFYVRTGSPTTAGYSVKDGMFSVDWGAGVGGEVWTDSPAGWLAVVDGSTGYTMVERNAYDPHANYPGQTTMLFFTTGNRQRRPNANANAAAAPAAPGAAAAPQRPATPVIYMEAEVDSPVIHLAPGESYAMDTAWYPTRMGEEFKTSTWAGVIGTPLAATTPSPGATSLTLTGNFGVFYAGTLVAHFYDHGGQPIGDANLIDVTPIDRVALNTTVQAPATTFRVSLHLVDKSGTDRGPLGEVGVNPPPPAPPRRGGNN